MIKESVKPGQHAIPCFADDCNKCHTFTKDTHGVKDIFHMIKWKKGSNKRFVDLNWHPVPGSFKRTNAFSKMLNHHKITHKLAEKDLPPLFLHGTLEMTRNQEKREKKQAEKGKEKRQKRNKPAHV